MKTKTLLIEYKPGFDLEAMLREEEEALIEYEAQDILDQYDRYERSASMPWEGVAV